MSDAVISCEELIAFIADHHDGTLAADAAREFHRHLAVCPSCVAYLAGYEQTIAAARLVRGAESLPEPVPEALVRAIRAALARR